MYNADFHHPDIPSVGVRHVVITEGKSSRDTDVREWADRQFRNDDFREMHFSFYTEDADAKASACERPPDRFGATHSCDFVINTNRPSYKGSIFKRR